MDGSYIQIGSKHSYIGEDSKSSCQRSSASRSLFYWLRPLLGSGGKQFGDPKTVLPLHPLSRNGAKRSRGLKHFNFSRSNSITKKKRPTRRVQTWEWGPLLRMAGTSLPFFFGLVSHFRLGVLMNLAAECATHGVMPGPMVPCICKSMERKLQ